eukprot:snap_masked-scaffold_4-processed-gene-8.15-mRNA-1 protein AED:0.04 eAED:0.04 QI:0/-1/0/1/-1/1/1/0/360
MEKNNHTEKPRSKRFRKDKPWDSDKINHWKIEPWKVPEKHQPLLEETSFAVLFPKYREVYLRDNWKEVKKALSSHHLSCDLNLIEGSMNVKTTRKTSDPYIILKARDFLKLLSRSIAVEKAKEILKDEMNCDVIKIGNLIRNQDRFIKRRQRLVGPKAQTLKAIELLTKCYIFVQGGTVSVMGNFKGLKQVRKIVVDCIQNNYHPIYHIKRLMIIRELEKDDKLKNESWDRFLPVFKNIGKKEKNKFYEDNQPKKKAKKIKKKYTPFPPAPQESKLDKQIESGEYFLNEIQRKERKRIEKSEKQAEKRERSQQERKRNREKVFEAPKEDIQRIEKKEKPVSLAEITKNVKSKTKKLKINK